MKANVFPSQEVCMDGKELRRLRVEAGLSQRQLARRIGWYRKKIERFEDSHHFCVHQVEMTKLLEILKA